MKKFLAAMLILSSTASAVASSKKDVEKFRKAMESIVGKTAKATSVKLVISKNEESLCDLTGETLKAEFQVMKYEKHKNVFHDGVEMRPKFETVKTYEVSMADLEALKGDGLVVAIKDTDDCQYTTVYPQIKTNF